MSLTIILLLFSLVQSSLSEDVYPVVLIPGDGGSQVEAKLNKTSVVHYICSKTSDWFPLWLNLELMVPEVIDCWADNIKLLYDSKTRTTRNNDGVNIRIPGFGTSASVEYLDTSERGFSVYFAEMVKRLLTLGYKRDVNIFGAPYDFRKAPNELGSFFTDYKNLIEKAYSTNKNIKVIIICHSMGCPITLYFFNQQTQEWKDKYIRSFISLAGVWAGTMRAMKVFSMGDNLGSWILNSKSLMVEQRTSPSLAWLMPSSDYWHPNETLVSTGKINLTVSDFKEFYYAFNELDSYEMWKDVRDINKGLKAPQVDTYCLHGTKVDTTSKLIYPPGTWPMGDPVLRTGDGDGTVNLRSLMACNKWSKEQNKPLHHHVFPRIDHLTILRDPGVVNYTTDILKTLNSELDLFSDVKITVVP
ncbi:lysosomal phospholipase A and acyltransferase [Lepeophtheirus salmonis]|uniref:lysosomal phospholipase A and acyltransferase n=1 Tax=Lepeophtheirus salmonis TaxID=72036 RepID=UPI001AE6C6CD|nr:phospholipase A2 group XV-like [Lepeophtheirus salmonis]